MREQPFNTMSYNLLNDLVNYLNTLSRINCQTSTNAGIRVSAALLEVIQGPCVGNQHHLALNTDLIETMNRLLRAKCINDCIHTEEIELKNTVVDIFQGLLEGQGGKVAIYEKVLSVIHMDIIVFMALGGVESDGKNNTLEEPDEDTKSLNTGCLVLLQMFCDYKLGLKDELGIRDTLDEVSKNVASIEIMWNGLLQRRFFEIPEICDLFSEPSKQAIVQEVDRSNIENKLLDFITRCHRVYKEIKYQVYLSELKLNHIINPLNLERMTWGAFYVTFIINALFISYYTCKDITLPSANQDDQSSTFVLDKPALLIDDSSKLMNLVIFILNIILIFLATCTLILYETVEVPVIYETMIEEEKDLPWHHALFYSCFNPMAIYYFIYLVVAILGLAVDHTWLPFLLLDIIVKNDTAKNVLNAVVYPWKPLSITLLIVIFVAYIYAFFLVYLIFFSKLNFASTHF
jgi:hypothetical protein